MHHLKCIFTGRDRSSELGGNLNKQNNGERKVKSIFKEKQMIEFNGNPEYN